MGAAVAVPSLTHFARRRQSHRLGPAQMLAVLQYAQDRAVSTGSSSRFQIDPAAGTYWVSVRRDGAYTRMSDDFGRTFSMPDNVKLEWNATADVAARGYLEFDPDGGHDMAVFHVIAGDGTVTLLGCASPSEPYRIGVAGVDEETR